MTPGHPADLKPFIRKAARAHIPVVCVATDAPGTERLTAVSVDAFTSGSVVAELFSSLAARPASVLIVTGDLTVVDHAEKVDGFRSFLSSSGSPIQVAGVIEAHDDPERADNDARFLRRASGNWRGVCQHRQFYSGHSGAGTH